MQDHLIAYLEEKKFSYFPYSINTNWREKKTVIIMHVSIVIEDFNANKTYKISVLLPSEKQTSYLYTYV